MMKHGGVLPAGYTQVEYIYPQSAGAYINLGWHPTKWTAFDGYMSIADRTKANWGLTSNFDSHITRGFLLGQVWSVDRWLGFKQSGTYEWNNELYSYFEYVEMQDNIHHHSIDLAAYMAKTYPPDRAKTDYYVDDVLIETGMWDAVMPSSKLDYDAMQIDMYLFAVNQEGSATAFSTVKQGPIRFFDEDGDSANFIPCTNQYGEAGMYDIISKSFHGAASGTILYKPFQ